MRAKLAGRNERIARVANDLGGFAAAFCVGYQGAAVLESETILHGRSSQPRKTLPAIKVVAMVGPGLLLTN